jgi:ubiquinol oxidase
MFSYSEAEMKAIQIAHRDAKTWSDKFALAMVRTMRWGMDFFTGYKHDHAVSIGEKSTSQANQEHRQTARYAMTEEKWLNRFVFLESVAGVPGFMASMVRHLSSLRRMERDNGWIETLQEEAYNERMHLLTFLPMIKPSWLMRMMIIGAQGVFANGMFIAYLISPRICHRFVGYLEEEAVITYSRAIADIENGKLPKWADPNFKIPEIAVRYWSMPEGKRTMRDLLLYVRADEAKHREVNHTLGNLEQHNDPNPFVSTYKDPSKPHPTKDLKDIRPTGWDREEIMGS